MWETLVGWVHQFHNLDQLVRVGGYTALFAIVFAETGLLIGFCLPGDSLLVTAGLVCALDGAMNIWSLVGILSVAAILGDSVGYAIGYHLGPRIFSREDSRLFHKDHLRRTQGFFERHGTKTIVLARFVPIVRTFAPTVAGVGKMSYRTFLTYNIMGGIGWVAAMTLGGYFLGRSIPNIQSKLHWVILGVIFVSFIPLIVEWRRARKEQRHGAPPTRPAGR